MSRKPKGPQAVTANRLGDGAVVYLAETGRWSTRLEEARLLLDAAQADAMLDEAGRDAATRVVGPYLIEVETGDAGPRVASLRERIRATGPTI
ncbi:DUF2849 domain-containing protein [Desertibaculum subflavum]|uniref:DUF2849 domain-containing protein n=1 Tax=Desertibaculum subflavum TaxID=2268458 RepID=UPI000E663C78